MIFFEFYGTIKGHNEKWDVDIMNKGTSEKLHKLKKENRSLFYQSKYDYYKNFMKGLIIVSSMAYITFFLTDCQIFGRFSWETLLSRLIIILPLLCYLLMYSKIHNYKIMVPLSYLMIHIIIWCTDWATYLLPDRQYASEGMIIMNLNFVCAGFCAPFWYSTIAHFIMLIDIFVANLFIHYDDVSMMVLFNLPCIIAVCAMHRIMEKVYLDHYVVSQKLEDLVVHDQLTKVYNRNKMKEISTADTAELNFPKSMNISVLLIDIDFFKKVNDQYGHEAGDVVLTHTASVLRRTVGSLDYIIRWGGEEFVIILPNYSAERGMDIAEQIRQNVENSDNSICPITVSIGVATYQGGNYHDTIALADNALYQAKTGGRNRVVQYI